MRPSPLVHLELHTGDRERASALYAQLLGWRPRSVGAYLALDLARGFGGGIVECGTARPVWIPYVEVGDVDAITERAGEPRRVGPARAARRTGRPPQRRRGARGR